MTFSEGILVSWHYWLWTEHTNAFSHDNDVIYSGGIKHRRMHWLNLNLYQYVHTLSDIGLYYKCPQHLLCVMCHHVTGRLLMQSVKLHGSKPLFKRFLVQTQPLDILPNMGQGLTSSCLTSSCIWVVLEKGFHLLETNDNTACTLLAFRSDKKIRHQTSVIRRAISWYIWNFYFYYKCIKKNSFLQEFSSLSSQRHEHGYHTNGIKYTQSVW